MSDVLGQKRGGGLAFAGLAKVINHAERVMGRWRSKQRVLIAALSRRSHSGEVTKHSGDLETKWFKEELPPLGRHWATLEVPRKLRKLLCVQIMVMATSPSLCQNSPNFTQK